MSIIDSLLNKLNLNAEDDDLDDSFLQEDDEEEEERKKPFSKKNKQEKFDREPERAKPKVTPIRPSKKQGNNLGVCVIKPVSFEDAKEITDTLVLNKAVILNLEGIDSELAKRIFDFAVGTCYAISGNLQKVSNYIFIITPISVDISGDLLEALEGFDSFNDAGEYR